MPSNRRSQWLSRRAVFAHLAVAIWVPGCGVAAWWQVTVALSGDSLGWLYSVEWPVFAIFGVIVWWNVVHDDPNEVGAKALRKAIENEQEMAIPEPSVLDANSEGASGDDEMAGYNAYLAELAASGERKTWRKR